MIRYFLPLLPLASTYQSGSRSTPEKSCGHYRTTHYRAIPCRHLHHQSSNTSHTGNKLPDKAFAVIGHTPAAGASLTIPPHAYRVLER